MRKSPWGRGKVEVSGNTELFSAQSSEPVSHNLAEDGWATRGGGSSMWAEDSGPSDPRGSWGADRQEGSGVGRACDTWLLVKKNPRRVAAPWASQLAGRLKGAVDPQFHNLAAGQIEFILFLSFLQTRILKLVVLNSSLNNDPWIITYKTVQITGVSRWNMSGVFRQPPTANICHSWSC